MAKPQGFTDSMEYFKEALEVLHDFQWIFMYPNTHILANDVFAKIPNDWKRYLQEISFNDLNNVALGTFNENAPDTFKEFIRRINKLKPNFNEVNKASLPVGAKNIKLSKKKHHEILKMAPIIDSICKERGITHLIDIGSGLGYLPELLHESYSYKILGIEANVKLVETASKNTSCTYRHHFVDENSANRLAELFRETFPEHEGTVCVTALHACADLTVDIIRVVADIPFASCAIIMPCCYHRLKADGDTFDNFPLSAELKRCYKGSYLNRAFLRLACQQTNVNWRGMSESQHDIHAKNCLFRNILQEVADENNIKIERRKRKTGSKSEDYNIRQFVENLSSYEFTPAIDLGVKIIERYDKYKDSERLIEALSALQALLQGVCENLVLYDRCVYTEGLKVSCSTIKVTDDLISPRCYALVMRKE